MASHVPLAADRPPPARLKRVPGVRSGRVLSLPVCYTGGVKTHRWLWMFAAAGLTSSWGCTRGTAPDGSEAPVFEVPPPTTEADGPLIALDAEGFRAAVRQRDARWVVVNVWATWCGPCREEFPHIQAVVRSFRDRGVALMFVTTDFESEKEAAVQFLRQQEAEFPSYMKTGPDAGFIEAVHPDWTGALPATVIYGPDRQPVRFWQGKVSEADLRAALKELVKEEGR